MPTPPYPPRPKRGVGGERLVYEDSIKSRTAPTPTSIATRVPPVRVVFTSTPEPPTSTPTPTPTATPVPTTYDESDCEGTYWHNRVSKGNGSEKDHWCHELLRKSVTTSIVDDDGGVLQDFKPLSDENMEVAFSIWMHYMSAPLYGITGAKFDHARDSFNKGYVDHKVASFMEQCLGGPGTDSPLEHPKIREELETLTELNSEWDELEFIKDRSEYSYGMFNIDGKPLRINLMYRVTDILYLGVSFQARLNCRAWNMSVREFEWDDIPGDMPSGWYEVDRSEALDPLTDDEIESLKLRCRLWCIEEGGLVPPTAENED